MGYERHFEIGLLARALSTSERGDVLVGEDCQGLLGLSLTRHRNLNEVKF